MMTAVARLGGVIDDEGQACYGHLRQLRCNVRGLREMHVSNLFKAVTNSCVFASNITSCGR